MALDYHDLRVAWDVATERDEWSAPKRDFAPLSMPVFWTWLVETAEQVIFLVRSGDEIGQGMAVSGEERRYFCRSLAMDLPPHRVLAMYTELGMGTGECEPDWQLADYRSATVTARRAVVEVAAQVLDALVAEE